MHGKAWGPYYGARGGGGQSDSSVEAGSGWCMRVFPNIPASTECVSWNLLSVRVKRSRLIHYMSTLPGRLISLNHSCRQCNRRLTVCACVRLVKCMASRLVPALTGSFGNW